MIKTLLLGLGLMSVNDHRSLRAKDKARIRSLEFHVEQMQARMLAVTNLAEPYLPYDPSKVEEAA